MTAFMSKEEADRNIAIRAKAEEAHKAEIAAMVLTAQCRDVLGSLGIELTDTVADSLTASYVPQVTTLGELRAYLQGQVAGIEGLHKSGFVLPSERPASDARLGAYSDALAMVDGLLAHDRGKA